jgi:hypothetical protein
MTTHDNETDAERTARNGQLTEADVKHLYAQKDYGGLVAAQSEGRLNVLMGGEAPLDPGKEITAADISRLYAQKDYSGIEALRASGRLNNLLGPTTTEGA